MIMDRKYIKALVIGKFQPLHKGHMSLIEFAKTQAQTVDMLVTAHDGEQIPIGDRFRWASETYASDACVSVFAYSYDPDVLSSSSESDVELSRQWADYLVSVHPGMKEVDVIVGSEKYVQFMAEYLGISYAIYDEQRENMKISATMIKGDMVKYWDYLSPAAKRSYVRHICICGSESTGKSTTCKRLEEEYGFVTVIPEIGRCLVGKSELCSLETLQKIYEIHRSLLEAVCFDPPTPIILWDTDSLTTLSYFRYLYPDLPITDIMAEHGEMTEQDLLDSVIKADKYFFFESNIGFHDDGTRFTEDEARQLSSSHINEYLRSGIKPEVVTASDRYSVVEQWVLASVDQLVSAFSSIN